MKENIVDVFNAWLRTKLEGVHTALPGEFVSFSGYRERKASVMPRVTFLNQKQEEFEIPTIDNVPVIFPSSGDSDVLFPISKGDGCLILFSESGIGNFLNSTRTVKPDSSERFNLTDAICIPGLWSFKSVPSPPIRDTSAWFRKGSGEIEIDSTELIGVRNSVTDLKSELDKIYGFFGDIANAVSSWVDTGGDAPNPATIALFTAIQVSAEAAKVSLATLMRS